MGLSRVDIEIKKRKIRQFREHAFYEIERYRATGRKVHLQQAAEKAYGAYTLLVELLKRREYYHHEQLRGAAESMYKKYRLLQGLQAQANGLHRYFYEYDVSAGAVMADVRTTFRLIGRLMRFVRR